MLLCDRIRYMDYEEELIGDDLGRELAVWVEEDAVALLLVVLGLEEGDLEVLLLCEEDEGVGVVEVGDAAVQGVDLVVLRLALLYR